MENKINRIASFDVNHDLLRPGIYISRVDGDVTTFDLRTRTPNAGNYMDNITMHSVEHMMATYLRNGSWSDHVIYFGPMGCRTGFYLLMRDLSPQDTLAAVRDALQKTVAHDGAMFGASSKECGNYRELDVEAAKVECRRYLDVLDAAEPIDFAYAR